MIEEEVESKRQNVVELRDDNIVKRALSGIPFFNFETTKNEAIVEFQRYKRAFPDMDEYELRRKVSKKLIKDCGNKSGNIGALMCVPAIIPMLESIASFGAIPVEQMLITKYNLSLMVKLAVINDYPLSSDNFIDTLVRSAKSHGAAGIITKLLLRLTGVCPVIGQIFTLLIGTPLCFLINKNETIKFGKTLLKEYDIRYDIEGFQFTLQNVLLFIITLILIGFASLGAYKMFFNNTNPKLNSSPSEQHYDNSVQENNDSDPQIQIEQEAIQENNAAQVDQTVESNEVDMPMATFETNSEVQPDEAQIRQEKEKRLQQALDDAKNMHEQKLREMENELAKLPPEADWEPYRNVIRQNIDLENKTYSQKVQELKNAFK